MRNFGWVHSHGDYRDYRYFDKGELVEELPQTVYLIRPPVKDQGNLGSCVFNAISTAMESVQIDQGLCPPPEYSRLYAYWRYRKMQGIPLDYDSGANPREAIKQIVKEGICLESIWPYDLGKWTEAPPPGAEVDAWEHKIKEYFLLETLTDMLHCLASGWGFVCGISAYENFDSAYTEKTGYVEMPSGSFLGGHMIYVCEYDMRKRLFGFQNSYGEWGAGGLAGATTRGRGTISFEYLTSNSLCGDRWTIRR